MKMGLKTHLLYVFVLLLNYAISGYAKDYNVWLDKVILNTGENLKRSNKIKLKIMTHEVIGIKFVAHYKNNTNDRLFSGWLISDWHSELPDYVEGWENKTTPTINHGDTASLSNIIFLRPSYPCNETFQIWLGLKEGNKNVWMNYFIVNVEVTESVYDHPVLIPEPFFTQGLSNDIYWLPTPESHVQDVYYFDINNPINLVKSVRRLYKINNEINNDINDTLQARFDYLENGHVYGYFAKAEYNTIDGPIYMYSDISYSTQDNTPPDPVKEPHALIRNNDLIELFWETVNDSLSGINLYRIYKAEDTSYEQLVDSIVIEDDQPYSLKWNDRIDSSLTYYYRIRAVDKAGNEGDGERSNGVTLINDDHVIVTPPDPFQNQDKDSFPKNNNKSFIRGSLDTLWLNLNGRERFIRFEAVRDSISYLQVIPEIGMRYFDSGWLLPDTLPSDPANPDRKYWIFDYSGKGEIDKNFVNGHIYIRRAIKKYLIASDTLLYGEIVLDCYPPDDIYNLKVEPVIDDPDFQDSSSGYSRWHLELSWKPATDGVSGLKRYRIYRKVDNLDSEFIELPIASDFTDTFFIDSLFENSSMLGNSIISYRVISEDHSGNTRKLYESDWEVNEWALGGPLFDFKDTDSSKFYPLGEDTVFTNTGYVLFHLNNFNVSNVIKFIVSVNGQESSYNNIEQDTLWLPGIEVSQIKVRAIYLGKRSSVWSEIKVAIQTSDSPPFNLLAINDSTRWNGNIYLQWERPSLDVVGYEVFRNSTLVGVIFSSKDTLKWVDYYDINELTNNKEIPLTAYEIYQYRVRKVDIFNKRSLFTDMSSSYCNKPPMIISHNYFNVEDTSFAITINWKRANPNKIIQGYETIVQVYQDDQGNLVQIESVQDDDTSYTYFNAIMGNNYIFKVRENPNNLKSMSSAWSQYYTVSLDTMNLKTLPQPKGHIFVYWEDTLRTKKYNIESYRVCQDDSCWIVPKAELSFMDSSLNHNQGYQYNIFALDSLDQIVAANTKVETSDTGSVFIPEVISFEFLYFHSDSIEVFWDWKDIKGEILRNSTRGASLCSLEVSVSKTFPSDPKQTNTTGIFQVNSKTHSIMISIPELVSRENEILYFRITAWDKWGHPKVTLWSTEFYEMKTAVYDPIAPRPVKDLSVVSIEAHNKYSDTLLVQLEWTGKGVQWPDSIGVYWDRLIANIKNYRVERKNGNNIECIREESVIEDYLKTYVVFDTVKNNEYMWRIIAVDSAMNETPSIWYNSPLYIPTPEPPKPGQYRGCTIQPLDENIFEYFVEIAMNREHFQWVYDINDGKMVDRFLCRSGWSTNLDFICTSGWGSMIVDTTWFRIKARKLGMKWESGWSSIVYYTENKNDNQEDREDEVSYEFNIKQNSPNPFNTSTKIYYQIPEAAFVSIYIYNITGAIVKKLITAHKSAGDYYEIWDGRDNAKKEVASGIYFVYILAETEKSMIYQDRLKMMVVK
jgi:hypothetical protein